MYEDNDSDLGEKSLAKLLNDSKLPKEKGGEEKDDSSSEDSSSDDSSSDDSSTPSSDGGSPSEEENEEEEEEEEEEAAYEFGNDDFTVRGLMNHLENSSETPEDRFALFFQLVPNDRFLKQSPNKLEKEYLKFVGAIERVQKSNDDPLIPAALQLLEKIYNLACEDLQRAQSKSNTETQQQLQQKQQGVQETRRSSRKQTKTPKAEAAQAELLAKQQKAEMSTNRRSLPTRRRIDRKRNKNRIEMYDAKGNKITGARLEEAIKKKNKTASFDAQGNKINQKPPPSLPPPPPLQHSQNEKPPAVDVKKERKIVKKNGKLKRSVFSRPTSIGCVKDRTVRDKIGSCARSIKQLQFCSTFEDQALRQYYPKCEHGMFTYDELKHKPHYEAIHKRSEPVFVFLPPGEDFDVKTFGKRLQKVGREMAKESGQGYRIAKDDEEYVELLCGGKGQLSKNASI